MPLLLRLKNIFIIMLASSMPMTTLASNVPLYDIEVVIFEWFSQGLQEAWPSNPGKPNLSRAAGSLNKNTNKKLHQMEWVLEDAQFGPIVHTLKQKGALVHAHSRWRQAVQNRKTPQWLSIGNNRLHGLVQMSRGRYLHFNTDLYLQKPGSRPYRVKLHRRMRSGETHYIDHPKVGIIVRAEPYAVVTERVKPEQDPEPAQPQAVQPEQKPKSTLPRAMPDPS